MASTSRPGTSFVKKEECTSIFPVPSHLVESFGGDLPSKVTFRTDESDKTWNLSIEKFKNRYFFTYGWQEFEDEVSLQSRKFLMYKPAASSKQKGKNKEEGRKISGYAHEATNSSLNENTNEGLGVQKKLEFCRKMKKHRQYRLDIPQDFALSTGLHKGVVLKLKNDEGKEWPVHVSTRADRISLCGGWCEFVIDNKLMIGSNVSFAWLSENTVQTKILEVGSKTRPLSNSAYKKQNHGLLEGDAASDEEELPENSLVDVINDDDGIDKWWKFSKDLKKQHSHSLDLPMSFSRVFGKATSGSIELVDSKKRTRLVRVVKYEKCSYFRMSSGWIDFLVGNKVSVGSTVVFKSIPNCKHVLKVRVIDGGFEKKELFVKRPRGRPSAFCKTILIVYIMWFTWSRFDIIAPNKMSL